VSAVAHRRAIFSRKSDDWSTPAELYDSLDAEFSFDLDPCRLGAFDGLLREWRGRVYVNPPYSNVGKWLEKGAIELASGRASVLVYLLPARTGTRWFHEHVLERAAEIRYIRGRLRFGNASSSRFNAPFDSMVVVFR